MVLDINGQEIDINGNIYYIGMAVVAQNCMFDGLHGIVTEIRTDDDRETENEEPDIYCDFFDDGSFAKAHKLKPDEVHLDGLIMASGMLKPA